MTIQTCHPERGSPTTESNGSPEGRYSLVAVIVPLNLGGSIRLAPLAQDDMRGVRLLDDPSKTDSDGPCGVFVIGSERVRRP